MPLPTLLHPWVPPTAHLLDPSQESQIPRQDLEEAETRAQGLLGLHPAFPVESIAGLTLTPQQF